jgi:general secretion pathway protein D
VLEIFCQLLNRAVNQKHTIVKFIEMLKKNLLTTWPSFLLILGIFFGCATKKIIPEEKPKPKVTVKVEGGPKPSLHLPSKPEPLRKPVLPQRPEPKAPVRPPVLDKDKYIVLNFDQADLQIVLQTISEILGMNYILGPKISGKITIQTYKKIPKEDIFSVLHSILEINGFTTVKTGHYYKIIPLGTAKQYPIKTVIGKDADKIPEQDIPVTQIIPLEFAAANEVASIIKSLISKNGNLITHKSSGLLILTDIQSNLRRLMKIINLLDTPAQKEILGERVFVYYVENGEADKIAKILTQIYKEKKRSARETRSVPIPRRTTKGKKAQPVADKGLDISEFEGELKIVADTEINALIIKTTRSNYDAILKVLKQIDIIPRQALIEVLIADISLTDDTKFGLEWTHAGGQKIGGKTFTQEINAGEAPATSSGLNYLLSTSALIENKLSMEATKGNVNILSSPYVLAADNKEAVIDIVDQIPIKKELVNNDGVVTSTSFEFKDAGIKLKVTPKINKKGLVNMKVSQEVSEPFVCAAGTGAADASCFKKRQAQTTVVVQDGQTLVIGGLIKETISHNRTGVPFLMDIPVLGYLFGSTTKENRKTELIILITPHVVHSHEDAAILTDQYKKRIEDFKKIEERLESNNEELPVEEL